MFLIKKNFKLLFFFYISIFFLTFIKIEYINPLNTSWLYNDNPDNAAMQAAWFFFKNDAWRFPLGLNPNYGLGLDNTIILTDSIPLFAIFFKLIASIVKLEFQYISFWYLLCFYLHFYFAFKIINFYTKDFYYSFVSANFFLLAPVFLYRLTLDPGGTSAYWILLWFIYYILKYKFDVPNSKILLILLISVSINIYFTAIISIPIFFLFLFKFFYKLENKFNLLKKYVLIYSLLLFLMYVLGYFSTPFSSSVGGGYGIYNLNLLTIFDPVVERRDQIWSSFFPSMKISQNSKFQAFNYLGLGQFLLILLALITFFKNRSAYLLFFKFEKKFLFFLGVVIVFLFFFALSNKIFIGPKLLLDVNLNYYLIAILSIFRVSSRFFVPITFILLIIAIIIIFVRFEKKKYYLLIIFLFFQFLDTFPGLKKNFKYDFKNFNYLNFDDIFSNYKIVNSTYPDNYNNKFTYLARNFEKFKTQKTNFTVQARFNKKKAAVSRVEIYNRLFNNNIYDDEVMIINNISHLKHLKTTLDSEKFVFFLRNNFWFVAKKEKLKMTETEINSLNNIDLDTIVFDEEIKINLNNQKYLGLGWTPPKEYNHLDNNSGMWSEGSRSALLFKLEGNEKISVNFFFEPSILRKNYDFFINIFVNNKNYKKILINNKIENNFSIIIDPKDFSSRDIFMEFNFSVLETPWEQAFKPDFRYLGIKLKTINFKKIY